MSKTNNLFYNAIALNHIAKKGGSMHEDFAKVLNEAGEKLTVSQLLQLSGEDFVRTNANEAMTTGQSGFGQDFVETVVLSAELIERLKNASSLLGKAVYHNMVAAAQDFPVRGARVRMILSSESNSYPGATPGVDTAQVKKAKTAKLSLSANEYTITVYYSDTLLEDSLIAIADYVMSEITNAFETSIHELVLNGDVDTGANTNINIIDGNTSALPDGNKTDLLGADGARKVALANSAVVNAATNLAIENIRAARALMGIKGVNPAELVLIPDQETYFDLMNLTEVETIEKFGDAATIKEGRLTAIDGIEIVNREELLRATASGEQSATPANNVLGQIVIIHAPSLHIGIRRSFQTEVSRYAENRQTGITGSTRLAIKFDNTQNNVSATCPCALIRNI